MPHVHIQRTLDYSPEQLFDLVADIACYPEFVPWCEGLTILEKREDAIEAMVLLGYKAIKTQFYCTIHLDRASNIIAVEQRNGPFKQLRQSWKFLPVAEGKQTTIWFEMEFTLRSMVLNSLAGSVCGSMSGMFVDAFVQRASRVYDTSI